MKLGISPMNDFAFAKTFARPENKVSLISLLNAILGLEQPIDEVTIRNPFNYRDFADDKLTILDINARDTRGRIFNVEMQLARLEGLVKRIVYYGCGGVHRPTLKKATIFRSLIRCLRFAFLIGVLWREKPEGPSPFPHGRPRERSNFVGHD